MLPIKENIHKWIPLALCLLLLFGLAIPIAALPTFGGHDIYFHVTRIQALAGELEAGHIPARLYSDVFGGYGYASPLFYGDLFLVIPALLLLAGMSLLGAYKAFIILCIFACVLVSYFCGKKMFRSSTAALCFVFVYCLSSYFAIDIFSRAALGEIQAFVFIPLAFAGLHSILREKGEQWYLLPLGLWAVLLCHLLTAAMTAVFLLVYALFEAKTLWKEPIRIGKILLSAGVFLLLSASFLGPFLEQILDAKFLSTDGSSATTLGTMEERAMSLPQMLSMSNVRQEFEQWVPNGLGLLPLLLVVLRLTLLRKEKLGRGDGYLLVSLFCIFFASEYFPWEIGLFQKLFGILQFPWRAFLYATLFLALTAADYAGRMPKGKMLPAYTSIVCAISLIGLLCAYCPMYSVYANADPAGEASLNNGQIIIYYADNSRIGSDIGTGEYLPSGTNLRLLYLWGDTVGTDGDAPELTRESNGDVTVSVQYSDTMGSYYDIPLIFYKGYEAIFTDEQGQETKLPIDYGHNNFLRVSLEDISGDGVLRVTYVATATQKISFVVTVLAVLAVAGYILYSEKFRKTK